MIVHVDNGAQRSEVTCGFGKGLFANRVEGGDESVKGSGGVVTGEPSGFAVEGVSAAGVVLFLAGINCNLGG